MPGFNDIYQEVPSVGDTYEDRLETQDTVCHAKFEKLRKAANNLKWRAKNLDAWNKLADEYEIIGKRLVMYDIYQIEQEDDMTVDQQNWYNCQLIWWSNNLRNNKAAYPDGCKNKLERFQVDRTVVEPRDWWQHRILDAGKVMAGLTRIIMPLIKSPSRVDQKVDQIYCFLIQFVVCVL